MEAKDYAYEIVAQLGYGGKLDERITTETSQQIIETALDNYDELRLSNVNGSVLSHSDFILNLKNLGFDVRVVGNNDRDYTFSLQVNAIRIRNKDYPLFGYYCGGAYVSCARTDKSYFSQKDVYIAIKKCSDILMEEIICISKTPSYFDCRDYLNSFGKSKIEKQSIKRVLDILKNNYQELIKSVIGFQHYR